MISFKRADGGGEERHWQQTKHRVYSPQAGTRGKDVKGAQELVAWCPACLDSHLMTFTLTETVVRKAFRTKCLCLRVEAYVCSAVVRVNY